MSRALGQWELLERLADSASGELWLARDRHEPGSPPVAVKLVNPDLARHAAFVAAFVEEARVAVRLDHPSLVQVHDVCLVDGEHLVALELVVGESLEALLARLRERGEALPVEVAARIVATAAEALHHVHSSSDPREEPQGLAHKGLHPANVLVTYDGRIKVSDFGLASAMTQVPAVRGLVDPIRYAYVSPEQCLHVPLDARSDVFSMGVLLWELVTGRRLFEGEGELAIKQAVVNAAAPAPSGLRADVPAGLDEVALRALAREPRDRYPDCHQLHLALEALVQAVGKPADAGVLGRLVRRLFPDRQAAWERRVGVRRSRTMTSPHSLLRGPEDGAPPARPRVPPPGRPRTEPADRAADLAPPAPPPPAPGRPTTEVGIPTRPRAAAAGGPGPAEEPPETLDGLFPGLPPSSPMDMANAARTGRLDRPRTVPVRIGLEGPEGDPEEALASRPARPLVPEPDDVVVEVEEASGPPDAPPTPPPSPRAGAALPRAPVPDGFRPTLFDLPEDEDPPRPHLLDLEAALAMPAAPPPTRALGGPAPPAGQPVADVVRYRRGLVHEAASLHRYRRRYGRSGVTPVAVRMEDAAARVDVARVTGGAIHRRGAHDEAAEPVQPNSRFYLHDGDRAVLRAGRDTWVVRLYPAPLSPLPRRVRLSLGALAVAVALALAVHVIGALGISALDRAGVQVTVERPAQAEQFADVRLAKVRTLRKKPAPPTPEKAKRAPPRVVKKARQPDRTVRPLAERAPPPPPEPKEMPPAPEGLQTAEPRLGRAARQRLSDEVKARTEGRTDSERVADMFRTPTPGAGTTVREAVSTLQAEAARGPTTVPRIGGTLEGLGEGEVNVALGGGGEEPGTVGGPQATERVARLEERVKPTRVRGTVKGLSAMARVAGQLDRGAVLKEIGRHQQDIQRCYERELMHSPGLGGKITFVWRIDKDGRVSGARQQTSTMTNAKVSGCILGVIRRMRFPKPEGGSVEVVYPFIFRSAS